ncbi:MAG: DNA repair protein RadA [Proteobacteria bacterium]|nr:DNA repair protein RadA [Pseudomonadota bacterium]
MARPSNVFVCQACGSTSPKWFGRCPDCRTWGSLIEEKRGGDDRGQASPPRSPVPVTDVPADFAERIPSGFSELDRVLGGGMVPGSVILLGGDPGIGKSTLLLQVLARMAASGTRVLYVTAEESLRQVGLRAERVNAGSPELLILSETDFGSAAATAAEISPTALVLDSVQALFSQDIGSAPGTISQVREIAARAVTLAKEREIVTWLVGHVTKEGAIAGPKALEHMVDTVLYFEGDSSHAYRMVRSVKNRFGAANELAFLEMTGQGLVQLEDPAGLFLPTAGRPSPGSVVVMGLEGSRPLLVEVQALVAQTPFPNPRRTVSGSELSRVLLILAVLDKRARIRTGSLDVFVNVAGGLQLTEPAADLGIALSIVSSIMDKTVPRTTALCGEIGLSGEIRPVPRLEGRLKEALRLGLKRAIVPAPGNGKLPAVAGMEILPVETIEDAIQILFR